MTKALFNFLASNDFGKRSLCKLNLKLDATYDMQVHRFFFSGKNWKTRNIVVSVINKMSDNRSSPSYSHVADAGGHGEYDGAGEVGVEFEFVVHGLLLTSVGIAGLFANIVCLIILCQPSLRRGQGSVNVILVRRRNLIWWHLGRNSQNFLCKFLTFYITLGLKILRI